MDAEYSLSWKGADRSDIKETWLYNLERKCVEHVLENVTEDVSEAASVEVAEPADNADYSPRILVHGGGWGIGEYNDKIEALNDLGYGLDIVIYYEDELPDEGLTSDDELQSEGTLQSENNVHNRYFLLDPTWKPDAKRNEYPRLLKYESGKWVPFGDNFSDVNPLRLLMADSIAVMSKPGGGTISDSFLTGTPLIFGDELATYENANKQLWSELGFGVTFDTLLEGCSESGDLGGLNKDSADRILLGLRENLRRARQGVPHVFEDILVEDLIDD